jgi:protein farnesyltransferase/geranylgeranyltransferase type-1 subunit alpha
MALHSPLDLELRLMDELAIRFLKTYQVWHHRRLILTQTRKPAPELTFIADSLQTDEKNYHTWSYRQWLLAHFNDEDLWVGELDFVEDMLEQDVRNNSAWHHRFFTVFGCGVRRGEEDRDVVVRRELECVLSRRSSPTSLKHIPDLPRSKSFSFTKQKIALAPNNASAWNYLRGILDHSNLPYSSQASFVQLYAVPHQSDTGTGGDENVVDLANPPPSEGAKLPSPMAIEFLADSYEKGGGDGIFKAIEVRFLFPSKDSLLTLSTFCMKALENARG